jgi:hypothetical protein
MSVHNRSMMQFRAPLGHVTLRSHILLHVHFQIDVNTEVGVVRDIRLKELRLYTDYGRCSRPLFIVENQRLLIKKAHIRALQQRV